MRGDNLRVRIEVFCRDSSDEVSVFGGDTASSLTNALKRRKRQYYCVERHRIRTHQPLHGVSGIPSVSGDTAFLNFNGGGRKKREDEDKKERKD
jgi:hypothetical protein